MTRARLSRSTLLLARVAGARVAVRGKTEASRRPRSAWLDSSPSPVSECSFEQSARVPRWPEKRAQVAPRQSQRGSQK